MAYHWVKEHYMSSYQTGPMQKDAKSRGGIFMNTGRIDRLQRELRSSGLSCAFIVPGPNLRYLTGLCVEAFERVFLAVIPAEGRPTFVLPEMEAERVRDSAGLASDAIYPYSDDSGPLGAIENALADLGLSRCSAGGLACRDIAGAEYLHMRLLERDLIKRAGGPHDLRDIGPVMSGMRVIKDADELAALQHAAEIVDIGIAAAKRVIVPGVTEREVAETIERAMLKAGAGSIPFNAVLSGPKGALPHGQTGDRVLHEGDMVICDIGAEYHGYNGDITRTFAVGAPTAQMRAVYKTVYESNRAGCERARLGLSGAEIDTICRDVIAEAGYGASFIHRTGHGLGLEIHEEPYIVQGNNAPLREGMVFTIEPGVYLPGVGGVRIEDDVVLTEGGCHILTSYPRELE